MVVKCRFYEEERVDESTRSNIGMRTIGPLLCSIQGLLPVLASHCWLDWSHDVPKLGQSRHVDLPNPDIGVLLPGRHRLRLDAASDSFPIVQPLLLHEVEKVVLENLTYEFGEA